MKQLSNIQDPKDLRALDPIALAAVVQELRDFIIQAVATKEGHLGASLGVVELTVALHYIFNTPIEPLIWDVGHQAYGHKILTGRKDVFESNRQWGGISGFPAREESVYDAFGVGHSSTAISAALGMALASEDPNKTHIAVVGDAAIAAGMAVEGLNHAGATKANLLVILNDNQMGIDPAVGALKAHFNQLNFQSNGPNFFTALGIDYTGVIDGHNLPLLIKTLEKLKKQRGPRILHIKTTKGKGLLQAETDQVTYHAPGKFNAKTGERTYIPSNGAEKYQEVFGKTLLELAEKNPEIMAITPAMPTGSSLKYMIAAMPKRALDVGISEQHAVTLAAGMAAAGKLPYCVVYSTFLQRAYDQLIHDVALQNLPVVFCIDRAGLVGQDGATHHGVFDLAYLLPIPNMHIAAPSNESQLRNLLYTAVQEFKEGVAGTKTPMGPLAIRYPRGQGQLEKWQQPFKALPIGKGQCLKKGSKIALLSLGPIKQEVTKALALIETSEGPESMTLLGHYDMIFAKPLDHRLLDQIATNYSHIVTIEDGVIQGGFGQAVAQYLNTTDKARKNINLTHLGIPDVFIGHGKPEELYHSIELNALGIKKIIIPLIKHTSPVSAKK